jgi:hypothetical protein
VESVFRASGEGTNLNAENINVFNITIDDPDPGWIVFEAEQSSTMQVSDSDLSELVGVIGIFVANTSAILTTTRTNVTNSRGAIVSRSIDLGLKIFGRLFKTNYIFVLCDPQLC